MLEQYEPAAPPEAYKTDMERAVPLEYGTHLVDMMRALHGEPRRVYARLHNINPRVRGESIAHVVYEYPEMTAAIEIAWKPGGARQAGVLVAGDGGEAYLEGTMSHAIVQLGVRNQGATFRDGNEWDSNNSVAEGRTLRNGDFMRRTGARANIRARRSRQHGNRQRAQNDSVRKFRIDAAGDRVLLLRRRS